MDINVNLNLPKPVNKFLNPIAISAGETLSNVWNGCFAYLNTWAQKQIFKNQQDFIAYKNSVEKKYADIPENQRKEPQLSLIGPAIEASKYYIEEPIIREMFSTLIAASMDKRKEHLVHHSFVDIIKQMAPNDATVLSKIEHNGPLAEIRVYTKSNSYSYRRIGPTDMVILPHATDSEILPDTISMSNLARLGLVHFDRIMSLSVQSVYDKYMYCSYYQEALRFLKENKQDYERCDISKGMFSLTQLGYTFQELCL